MIGIYKIISPSKKVYIGQSINIEKRFYSYLKLHNCKSQPKLFNSFKKYGVKKHIFLKIEECNLDEINEKERYYQELYSVIGKNGLNCVLQSTLELKTLVSDETKLKLSISNSGKKPSVITLEKMRASMMGKNLGSKNGMFGKKIKESSKSLQRIKLSGELNYLTKIILNTQTGIFYFGLREASDSINMKKATLHLQITKTKVNKTNFIYV